jgi:hypothetical protein
VEYRQSLVDYVNCIISETVPIPFEVNEDGERPPIEDQIFAPLLNPDRSDFDDVKQQVVYDVVKKRNFHSPYHHPTCFKRGSKKCRFRFPRAKVESTGVNSDGCVEIERDDHWLNPYNSWMSLITRANHDVRFLFTSTYALAIIHYVIKYMSKPENSVYSKLSIAAALAQSNPNLDGSTFLVKMLNKLDAECEVGEPQLYGFITGSPDHFTDCQFAVLNTNHLLNHVKRLMASSEETSIADSTIVSTDGGFATIALFDDYRFRGEHVRNVCLYDYCSLVTKSRKHTGIDYEPEHPQARTHSQHISTSDRLIPNLVGRLLYLLKEHMTDEETDDYYCLISTIFIAWGGPVLWKPREQTWRQYFEENQTHLSDRILGYIDNLRLLRKSKEEMRLDRAARRHAEPDEAEEDTSDDESVYEDVNDSEDFDGEDSIYRLSADRIEGILNSRNIIDGSVEQAITCATEVGYFVETMEEDDVDIGLRGRFTHEDYSARPLASSSDESSNRVPAMAFTLGQTPRSLQKMVADKHKLNERQKLVLQIVCDQALGEGKVGEQLLLGVFGEGGTGKTRVINAIRDWFSMAGRGQELEITATTGAAAFGAKGTTVHSALAISKTFAGKGKFRRKVQEEYYPRQTSNGGH